MKRLAILVLGCLASLSLVQGQTAIDDGGRTMMDILKTLSDDAMEGRLGGTPGGERAVEYITARFKEWGVAPAGDKGTYFQTFPLKDLFLVKPGVSFAIDRGRGPMPFFYQERNMDWGVIEYSGSGRVDAEIVFVGYGLSAPEQGYDDYAGVDVRGKAVLLCSAAPPVAQGQDLAARAAIESRLSAARQHGAAAVLLFDPPVEIGRQFPIYFPSVRLTAEAHQADLPVIGIGQKILTYLFDDQKKEIGPLLNQIRDTRRPASYATGVRTALTVETESIRRIGVNVLGRIEGRDRRLKNEYVIVGAHMDHLGVGPDGLVMNGANDNASGTSVVMEMARRMKASGFRPERTLIFALWGAEEEGLIGSSYYARHPLYPLGKTVAAFALDCVGYGERIQFGGVYYSSDLWDYLKKNLDPAFLENLGTSGAGGGSDQIPFHAVNTPAFHFVSIGRDHGRIHHQRDDWDLINPEIMNKTLAMATQAVTLLANGPANLIASGREALINFRRRILVDYRGIGVEGVLARTNTADYQDVDFQLAVLDGDKNLSGAENAVALIKKTARLSGDLGARKDLKAFALDNDLFYGGWRTKVIAGLRNVAPLMSDPDTLLPLVKSSLLFAVLEPGDLMTSGRLGEAGKATIAALEKAGLLVVLKGFDETGIKDVLGAVAKPPVVVGPAAPSAELAGLVKKTGALYGLEFGAAETPEAYAARLKTALDAVGSGQLVIWNNGDLSTDAVKAAFSRLLTLVDKEPWNAAAPDRINALTREGVSGLLAGNFMNLLLQTRRAVR